MQSLGIIESFLAVFEIQNFLSGNFSTLALRGTHLALSLQISSHLCCRSKLLEEGYAFLVETQHTLMQYKEM
jgi:hypothetical protein